MHEFARTRLLLGDTAMDRLAAARVAVFGIGGVGGYVVEALARSGVGALDLVDSDTISLSNINRQIIALHSTDGLYKVDVAAQRVHDINPACEVRAFRTFFLPETAADFDFAAYDYVVDAVDTVKAKMGIILAAQSARVPVISCMGAGNKLDPLAFRIADIYDTSVCPLARVMRTQCRKAGIAALKVLYSTEPPLTPGDGTIEEPLPQGKRSLPGSCSFVPSVAGLIIASEVIRELTGQNRTHQD